MHHQKKTTEQIVPVTNVIKGLKLREKGMLSGFVLTEGDKERGEETRIDSERRERGMGERLNKKIRWTLAGYEREGYVDRERDRQSEAQR